jgi:ribosomal-protein-alanine N-acetyltransferase
VDEHATVRREPGAAARPDGAEPGEAVVIEPMRNRHLRAVRRIDRQVYRTPWSTGLYLQELAQRDTRLYVVARVRRSIVGYGGLMAVLDDGHVTSVAVDPAWEGRGVGTRLMLALAAGGVAMGCQALTLEVRMSNDRAQGLYRRFGFGPAGVRKDYYPEFGEDALVMWAHDVHLPPYQERLAAIAATVAGDTFFDDGIVAPPVPDGGGGPMDAAPQTTGEVRR